MTSSSTDAAVVRGLDAVGVRAQVLDTDLRTGAWTRLGGSTVLGDTATEAALHGLAETARSAARAQGYAVGWSEGRRAGEERARAEAEQVAAAQRAEHERQAHEHAAAVDALREAARQLRSAVDDVCGAVQAQAVDVALGLTEAVLGREVALATEPAADAMRRALALVPAGSTVTVRLHPASRSAVDLTEFTEHGVTLVDDPALGRADAVVETDTAVVDATVAAALARVREVLAP